MIYDQKKVDFVFSIDDTNHVNRAGDGKLAKDFGSVMRRFWGLWLKGETGLRKQTQGYLGNRRLLRLNTGNQIERKPEKGWVKPVLFLLNSRAYFFPENLLLQMWADTTNVLKPVYTALVPDQWVVSVNTNNLQKIRKNYQARFTKPAHFPLLGLTCVCLTETSLRRRCALVSMRRLSLKFTPPLLNGSIRSRDQECSTQSTNLNPEFQSHTHPSPPEC